MRISDSLVLKLLKETGKVSEPKLEELMQQGQSDKKPLQDLAIKQGYVSEKDLTKMYAQELELPFVELNPREIKMEVLKLIPERVARQYNVVVFDVKDDGTKMLAMSDPDDIQAINFLRKKLGANLEVNVAVGSAVLAALDLYRGNISSELTKVITPDEEEKAEEENQEEVKEEDLAEDSPIAQTVNLIIEYAVKSGASDIHIEPTEENVLVRYRIDGVLKEANKLPKKVINSLVSRIKILANLKIDEHRAPQDGRFKVEISGGLFALRVSTLPVVDGEKVVMRILNESSKAITLDDLGFWGYSLKVINKAITQPHGMILVTGPTGSGKSTTLFSVLSLLNKPQVNISTVEDPVEYRILGANQTQVNPVANMTFASGLRALLRQDPNIIMVGEIRDVETASLAVQAALTGHLVFSTLHTNNAATCLPRLLDMKIEPFLIASTVRAVVGQRLVRKLCNDCKQVYQPNADELKQIAENFHTDSAEYMKYIHGLEEEALKAGIGTGSDKSKVKPATDLSSSESKINRLWRVNREGCETCGHSGYRGRVGIYEVLDSSQEIQKQIVANATSADIQQQAVKEGTIIMQVDGLIKALRGQTSIEEILRVTADK